MPELNRANVAEAVKLLFETMMGGVDGLQGLQGLAEADAPSTRMFSPRAFTNGDEPSPVHDLIRPETLSGADPMMALLMGSGLLERIDRSPMGLDSNPYPQFGPRPWGMSAESNNLDPMALMASMAMLGGMPGGQSGPGSPQTPTGMPFSTGGENPYPQFAPQQQQGRMQPFYPPGVPLGPFANFGT